MLSDRYWHAVLERDRNYDGVVIYGVVTTRIYCVPSCPSGKPKRINVIWFDSYLAAEIAGFRPCKRCLPRRDIPVQPKIKLIEEVCREIEDNIEHSLTLVYLARKFNLSTAYLQRIFKQIVGITPKQYREITRFSNLFMRIAAPVIGPVLLIELRVLIAGLILSLLSLHLNLLPEVRQQLVPLLVVGCINSVIPFLLFAIASLYLPAGFTSILNATAPLFGTLIAGLWLREHLSVSQFIGLIIGFSGVTILIGWTSMPISFSFVWSVGAGLTASFLYAIAAPYAKQKLSDVDPITVATGSQLGATLILLPITPFFLPEAFPSLTIVLVTLALGILSTALAYVLYFRLIANIGASKALTVAYLIPLFAMLWGALVLGEPITQSMILGCSLILSGTAIAVYQ